MPQLHKCAKPDCNAQCSKEFCRHHSQNLNDCKHPGCKRRCRNEFCRDHKPETMAKARAYAIRYREQRKTVQVN